MIKFELGTVKKRKSQDDPLVANLGAFLNCCKEMQKKAWEIWEGWDRY